MQQLFDQPTAECRCTLDDEGDTAADTIRATLQVIDRQKRDWPGRWLVLVYIATAAAGAPGGTQTTAVPTGSTVQAITANTTLLVLTDSTGLAEIDITVAGAATRYVYTTVLGRPKEHGPLTFA